MDFITNIYTQILNLIKTILTIFGVDTSAVDEYLKAVEGEADDETTATVA